MEKRENIDIQNKWVTKLKWIIFALLLALWSSSFSYSQENDSIKKDINITELESYQKFRELELSRTLTINERNSAFQMFFKLISNDTRHWFTEFSEIDDELKNVFDKMPKDENYLLELDNFLKELDYLYMREKNVECRLAITYMKSRILDEKNRHSDWAFEVDDLLKKQLKVWDIVLLNKKNSPFDIWTKALKIYDEKYLTDFTHVLIFIWFDDVWNILVRHSTTATEKFHKIGVENTELNSYIFDKDRSNAEWYDIVVLRPIPEIKQSILNFSENKIWCWYDNRAALREWLWLENDFNNKYNCGEIVTQWIQMSDYIDNFDSDMSFQWKLYEKICRDYYDYLSDVVVPELKTKTFPNDFFDYLELFNLKYVCTLKK